MADVDVVQVAATTKKDLVAALKIDPSAVRFVPAVVGTPLDLAFKSTADRIPLGHTAHVYGPRFKWQARVTRTENGVTVK